MVQTITAGGRHSTKDEYIAEERRIVAAMRELEETCPNLRDYWPHMERWDIARLAAEAKGLELRELRAANLADFNEHCVTTY